ncbi:putative methyltransferase NSUN7 [Carassius auratus]|uniref:Methyltransferase NSUN7 n=1 Tax=Carassius auratus TaxID=7957 RepID=A0A6P6QP93_CARAU|nr:putative methyltransferase NSUN7 [Carassius auratus]
MVRKSMVSRRSSKRGSQISALKHLSLLDPAPAEPPLLRSASQESPVCPDRVYLHAAAIFQSTHLEKPPAHRLISYGKRSEVRLPVAKDEASQRSAYQLAFNTLKYQELLEDVLIDSCFCLSQPMPLHSMSLVTVMLNDLMDRKFLPRPPAANQEEEEVKAVQEVEACLLRFRTKLVASLARCRIKHELLTLENMVPEQIRHREERATLLPLYGWINSLRSSLEEVSDVLHTSGFSCVKSVGQLEGQTFCKDLHCRDLLVFHSSVKNDLSNSRLLSDGRLIIQDKSCCVGPWALWPLLAGGGDVLMSGCFSAQTVAHVSAVAASAHTQTETHTSQSDARGRSAVIVCLGDGAQTHTEELQNTLTKLSCKNVKLLPDSLESLDVSDVRLQKISVVFLMPACSLSAISNPVDYIMQENRDPRLMLDLSQGSVSPEKIQMLVCQQRKVLQRAVQFPQVRAVLYSTCSVHPEENEEVLMTVLSQTQESHSTAPPYRLTSPSLLQDSIIEDDEESEQMKDRFFRLEASDHSNGCFLALLTREPEPEVIETPQEVLARAAAKGLLDGLHPNQPIKKEGRGRRSRRAPANQKRSVKTRPHATQSDQSRVAEFLNREMKGSSSEPTLSHQNGRTQSPRSPAHYDQLFSSQRPSQSGFSRTGSASSPAPFSKTGSAPSPAPLSISGSAPSHAPLSKTSSAPSHAPFSSSYHKSSTHFAAAVVSTNDNHSSQPHTPPKGRQEVLHPATVTFPPVLLLSDGVLPQRRSHGLPARPSPAHTNLQWRNSTPALPRSQTLFRLNHLRPWL